MLAYAAKRLLLLIPVLLGISSIVFATLSVLPGGTALALLGPYANEERIAEIEQSLGLGDPMPVRFARWIGGVARGELGHAYSLDRPVADVLLERLGPTLLLAGTALALGTLAGLLAGSVAARHHGRAADLGLRLCALIGISVPAFWLSLVLVLVLAVELGWFPASGMLAPPDVPHAASLLDRLQHLVLPALALGSVSAGVIARIARAELIEVQASDFVRTARAKGLSVPAAVYGHALRVALARVVPAIGLQAGFVIGGAVYVESVFAWPGLGQLLVEAIAKRDLFLVQGAVLVLATAYVLVNLATDLVQRALDPRTIP